MSMAGGGNRRHQETCHLRELVLEVEVNDESRVQAIWRGLDFSLGSWRPKMGRFGVSWGRFGVVGRPGGGLGAWEAEHRSNIAFVLCNNQLPNL